MTTQRGAPPGTRPDGAEATERPDQAATSVLEDSTVHVLTIEWCLRAPWRAGTGPKDWELWALHEDLWAGPHVTAHGPGHCGRCRAWGRVRELARERGWRGPTTARRHRAYRRFLGDLAAVLAYAGGGRRG